MQLGQLGASARRSTQLLGGAVERDHLVERCRDLEELAELPPGYNPPALGKAKYLVAQLSQGFGPASDIYAYAQSIGSHFESWFSPRKWERKGDGGSVLHHEIIADLCVLKDIINRNAPPN